MKALGLGAGGGGGGGGAGFSFLGSLARFLATHLAWYSRRLALASGAGVLVCFLLDWQAGLSL